MNKAVRKAQRDLDSRVDSKDSPRRIARASARLEKRVNAYENKRVGNGVGDRFAAVNSEGTALEGGVQPSREASE